MTTEFKPTDFVQVEWTMLLESGEPTVTWRNALYVMNDRGNHVVIYADGQKHELHKGIPIRKPVMDNP